jgi:pimeloyl-ACP methyl ester carboxylesterase
MKRIAIVAVHGVIPQPKHGFQDQVAAALTRQLNRGPAANGDGAPQGPDNDEWTMDVVFPEITKAPTVDDPVGAARSTIVRIHSVEEPDARAPSHDFFDIIEAYWSPIDKNRTNAWLVLSWLLKTIFEPLNTTARYGASSAKKRSDFLSILLTFVLGLIFFGLCLLAVGNSFTITLHNVNTGPGQNAWWHPLVAWPQVLWKYVYPNIFASIGQSIVTGWSHLAQVLQLLWAPNFVELSKVFSPAVLLRLGLGAIGAFLVAQAARGTWSVVTQWKDLSTIPVQRRSRIKGIVFLVVTAVACFALCALWTFDHGKQLGTAALWLVFAALSFEVGKASTATFLTNFFGDVQIYCTHDQNATLFEFRTKILDLVTRTIVETIKAQPAYDRVYVFAHSLGSTIALDALMRVYDLLAENGVQREEFDRIRGFVTFGTALEKTRFFLDSYNASLSATFDEWRGAYYGALFDSDSSILALPNAPKTGIYWANYWFFNDFIADRISTYRSFLPPGESVSKSSAVRREVHKRLQDGEGAEPPLVAQNRVCYRLPSALTPILHGEYLASDWFWREQSTTDSSPSWLAKLLGSLDETGGNDCAIGALAIVTSHEHEQPSPAALLPTEPGFAPIIELAIDDATLTLALTSEQPTPERAPVIEASTEVEGPLENQSVPTPREFRMMTENDVRSSQLRDIIVKGATTPHETSRRGRGR